MDQDSMAGEVIGLGNLQIRAGWGRRSEEAERGHALPTTAPQGASVRVVRAVTGAEMPRPIWKICANWYETYGGQRAVVPLARMVVDRHIQ